jgi:hypothetical protein
MICVLEATLYQIHCRAAARTRRFFALCRRFQTIGAPRIPRAPRREKRAVGRFWRKISRTAYIHFPHQIRITT